MTGFILGDMFILFHESIEVEGNIIYNITLLIFYVLGKK